jgi:hypothetical protein
MQQLRRLGCNWADRLPVQRPRTSLNCFASVRKSSTMRYAYSSTSGMTLVAAHCGDVDASPSSILVDGTCWQQMGDGQPW